MRLTNHATVVSFSRKREAAGSWEKGDPAPLSSTSDDDIPVKPDVDTFCWSHFGWGGETLSKRYNSQKDRVVKDTEVYTIYQLGNTDYQYRIRETRGLPGIIIDVIWKEEDESGYEEEGAI